MYYNTPLPQKSRKNATQSCNKNVKKTKREKPRPAVTYIILIIACFPPENHLILESQLSLRFEKETSISAPTALPVARIAPATISVLY